MPADDSVVFHNVSFQFDTASQTLSDDLSVHFSHGFTGVVGANGSDKTTLLRLARANWSLRKARYRGRSMHSTARGGPTIRH